MTSLAAGAGGLESGRRTEAVPSDRTASQPGRGAQARSSDPGEIRTIYQCTTEREVVPVMGCLWTVLVSFALVKMTDCNTRGVNRYWM